MEGEYNKELCDERHHFITKGFEKMDIRLKKVENRFLAIITTVLLTLVGVIINLIVILTQKPPGTP